MRKGLLFKIKWKIFEKMFKQNYRNAFLSYVPFNIRKFTSIRVAFNYYEKQCYF